MANETELTEVQQAVLDYAIGNPGIIRVLIEQVNKKGLTTAQQVAELVGWPLSQHSVEKTEKIWDMFSNG